MRTLASVLLFLAALVVPLGASTAVSNAQRAPSAFEISGFSGLHRAAHEGDVETLKRLISEGADLEARDANARTPLHIAAFASHEEIVRELAKAGANMNALEGGKYDAVTIAAVANDPELMSVAIEAGNDPGLTTSIYDGTALIAAAHLGHHEVVRRLVEAGAPLDHVNNLGWTALIEAVILGDGGADHQRTVEILLDAGADASIPDRNGETPLELAVARGYGEIADRIRQSSQ